MCGWVVVITVPVINEGDNVAYSRPAIEFQAALKAGDRFTPMSDYASHAGKVLVVDGLLRKYKDPDDSIYWIKDEEGNLLEPTRCWWLRKCCRRVEGDNGNES